MPKPTRPPIGLVLANTAKTVSRAFETTMAEAGGSGPTWLILIALKSTPDANQREIAAAVGIQGATLTHHLNAMETNGLVTRTREPANRRVHQVRLTEQGEQLFHQLADAARAHDKRLRSGFTDDELATLEQLLGRMRANVTED
ncbi:MAG TPA: MarR family winged helix-turn-helix transcriptional regulator [Pseudonocardiaceae bacterium]|nr:MarR family winged helix-turn-helix transcriptional regulator [Pseudonocardiaceae bacterium]